MPFSAQKTLRVLQVSCLHVSLLCFRLFLGQLHVITCSARPDTTRNKGGGRGGVSLCNLAGDLVSLCDLAVCGGRVCWEVVLIGIISDNHPIKIASARFLVWFCRSSQYASGSEAAT